MDRFEERVDQAELSKRIWTCFENNSTAICEAGTGIGKSIAYLAPALLWAEQTGEKVVISTYTIALQEQLLEKEIPLLLSLLELSLNVKLVKGMGNYICLRKLEDPHVLHQLGHQAPALLQWARETREGSQSALPFSFSPHDWQKVHAESRRCNYGRCPHFRSCFFFDSRRELEEAHILIVNHSLLLTDLVGEKQQRILPDYKRLIIDEAHHFEDVALQTLSEKLSVQDLWKPLQQIHSTQPSEKSRLRQLDALVESSSSLHSRLSIDLPAAHAQLFETIQEAFLSLPQATRIQEKSFERPEWKEPLHLFPTLIDELKRFGASLQSLRTDTKEVAPESLLFELESAGQELQQASDFLKTFFKNENTAGQVRWTQTNRNGATLSLAHLNVSSFLREKLVESLKTLVFCSATLTVQGRFDYFMRLLGLTPEETQTLIYPSPFDYKTRTLLLASKDFPEPNDPLFLPQACDWLFEALTICGGGAFLLFTSYEQLSQAYAQLAPRLEKAGFKPLRQGEVGRFALLQTFKQLSGAVLFGTDSFWEGVDVPGDALRFVALMKLPFKSPSDPLVEARAEELKKQGKEPFLEELLPHAIMKFKQGFGRLMRRKEDRGCVVCLDRRLLTKAYGKQFISSLPETLIEFGNQKELLNALKNFYGA